MLTSRQRLGLIISNLLTGSFCALPAHAAETTAGAGPETGGIVQEVIVTATRQERALSKVPVSISAFSQEQLEAQSVRQIDDIARLTPGLQFTRASGLGSDISIRGIASTVGASTTGVYIDDVPVQVRTLGFWATNSFPLIFDLERVEVLRGPQGTLFGAGSEGGTVRFITPAPSTTGRSGHSRAEIGFTSGGEASYEVGAALGGPLADTLGFRVSAYYRKDGGFVDRESYAQRRLSDRDSDWQEGKSVRAAFGWAPTENLTITPAVYYQELFKNDQTEFWEERSDLDAGRFRNASALSEPVRDDYVLPSLNVQWHLGPVDLISTTSYFDRKADYIRDYSALNLMVYNAGNPYPPAAIPHFATETTAIDEQENFVQEIRLQSARPDARLTWVFGIFFAKMDQRSIQIIDSPDFDDMWELSRPGQVFEQQPRFVNGLTDGRYWYLHEINSKDDQLAGFGEVTWRMTDRWSLTAGLRVARAEFEFDGTFGGPSNGPTVLRNGGATEETPVTPKVGLSFQANDANLFYATASKGYRTGGAQARLAAVCNPELAILGLSESPITYDSDSVWSYELGMKNRLAEGRVRMDTSVYRIDWSDIQSSIPLRQCANSIILNLGKATSEGFDIQAEFALGDHFTLGTAIGYTDAKFSETVLGSPLASGARAVIIEKGDAISQSSRPWSGVLSAQADFSLFGNYESYVRADYTYNSEADPASINNPITSAYDPAITVREATKLLNLRAGASVGDMDISLFVKNALDSAPVLTRAHAPRAPLYEVTTFRPRTIGVTVSYKF
jgi:iron complex outermembrane receptor protein